MKHLDNEYRRRWIEFHADDESMSDSRQTNWRDVGWKNLNKIVVLANGNSHEVTSNNQSFKFFMNFRWGGLEAKYDEDNKYTGHKKINIWTIGWTDGITCYLKDIDFYTGDKIKDYEIPLERLTGHIHPDFKEEYS